jgi:hypothetical protein
VWWRLVDRGAGGRDDSVRRSVSVRLRVDDPGQLVMELYWTPEWREAGPGEIQLTLHEELKVATNPSYRNS